MSSGGMLGGGGFFGSGGQIRELNCAVTTWNIETPLIDITAANPRSAVSRRTLASIARAAGASARQLAQAKEADASAGSADQ